MVQSRRPSFREQGSAGFALLSITQIQAGDAYNVIPGSAVLRGTVRTYTVAALGRIEEDHAAHRHDAAVGVWRNRHLDFRRAYPPLVNWEAETAFAAQVVEQSFGSGQVDRDIPPFMGAEDFSFFLEKVPGCYLFLGNGDGDHRLKPTTAWGRPAA